MPRGSPDTETTRNVSILEFLEMVPSDRDQSSQLGFPPWVFNVAGMKKQLIGRADTETEKHDLSMHNTHLEYLAKHPPEYGLITNFPPGSWDSACFFWAGVREILSGLGQEDLGDYKKERNYRIEQVGPEGKGVVAARDFGVGDVILLERPATVQPLVINGWTEPDQEALLGKMVDRLPADVRKRYLALSNHYAPSRFGILRTNCNMIHFPGNDAVKYMAVVVDFSRCNHSCSPNVTHKFNPAKFALELRALRPIKANEQITISYINKLDNAASRSGKLLDFWRFNCTCPSCILPPRERRQSDRRRAEVGAFRVPFEGPLYRDHEAQMHAAITALVTSTKEQLWNEQQPMLAFLAFRSLALGDVIGWKKWAPKAAALTLACHGKSLHYYFYSAAEPTLLRPFWNSKSLVGMLDEGALIMTVNVECMLMLVTAQLHDSNN